MRDWRGDLAARFKTDTMSDSPKNSARVALENALSKVTCPGCDEVFAPFAGRELTPVPDPEQNVTCPKCSEAFPLSEGISARDAEALSALVPAAKPADTRIELTGENGAWVYSIPRERTPWGLLGAAVFVNVIVWANLIAVVATRNAKGHPPRGLAILALFAIGAVAFLYWVVRKGFATYRLALSPQAVRLERKLISRRVQELPLAEITSVAKAVFYTQNYQPVYGLEIQAGARRIRFGSGLREDEKNWLCWEIREFVRQRGAPLA